MFSIDKMAVFVTGGATGIGAAVCARLIAAGARVIVADIAAPEHSGSAGAAEHVQCDVAIEEQVRSALQSARSIFGCEIDAVINNAGIGPGGPFIEESDTTTFERVLSINLFGTYFALKHAPRYMRDGGAIVNTASLATQVSFPGLGQYGASKAAIVQLARSSAVELGARGIRVNVVNPSVVRTPMLDGDEATLALSEIAAPLGRTCRTEDLVGLYHFLIAPESAYITGQVFAVDGGWTAGISTHLLTRICAQEPRSEVPRD